MKDLIIINPYCPDESKTERLEKIIKYCTDGYTYKMLVSGEEVECADLKGKRILFTISLGESGINLNWYSIMKYIRLHKDCFEGSVGGVIVDGSSELFTKSFARSLVFTANMSGCTFPGRSLVEGTRTLYNYNIQAKNLHLDNFGAYENAARELVNNIMSYEPQRKENPDILVLHACTNAGSNTLALWHLVETYLPECNIIEIPLRNGEVLDCRGCSYEVCRHFGESGNCFYGGTIPDRVFPAILECDALVMVCPNYNDAVSANLTAFINRLTALFTANRFYEKNLYGIIVSGYSGGDIIAEQLISAMNMNKTFALPGKFAMLETAYEQFEILKHDGIEERAKEFADRMRCDLIS